MGRLTGYDADGGLIIWEEARLLCSSGIVSKDEIYKIMRRLAERLAEYEDLEERCIWENSWGLEMLLEKWNIFHEEIQELFECKKLEEQRKLLKLPCAVGDMVYTVRYGVGKVLEWKIVCCEIYEEEVVFIDNSETEWILSDFGKTVFLTQERAEAALQEMKKKERERMKFNLGELQIIERLLSNRLNVDFDSDIEKLLRKVRNRISEINYHINRSVEWANRNK